MAKVMIVDDEPDVVETVRTLVEKQGFTADAAHDGREFLDKLAKSKPNLVLLDVMMPGLSTREILDKVHEMGLKTLKIILVTVVRFTNDEIRLLAKRSNIVEYVTKPFDIEELARIIKRNL